MNNDVNSAIFDAITDVSPGLPKARRRAIAAAIEEALPEASERARMATELERLQEVILRSCWQSPASMARSYDRQATVGPVRGEVRRREHGRVGRATAALVSQGGAPMSLVQTLWRLARKHRELRLVTLEGEEIARLRSEPGAVLHLEETPPQNKSEKSSDFP